MVGHITSTQYIEEKLLFNNQGKGVGETNERIKLKIIVEMVVTMKNIVERFDENKQEIGMLRGALEERKLETESGLDQTDSKLQKIKKILEETRAKVSKIDNSIKHFSSSKSNRYKGALPGTALVAPVCGYRWDRHQIPLYLLSSTFKDFGHRYFWSLPNSTITYEQTFSNQGER